MSIKSSTIDQNKSGDNDSLEKSIQTMTDLLKTFIKKTSQSHSTYYKPSQKYHANRNSDQRQSYRNSNQTHTIGGITAITEIIQELMR